MGRFIKVGFGLSTLVGVLLVPTGTAAAVDLPPDCAVPPFVDVTQFNVIIGSDAGETITGTAGPDLICGRLGDDTIRSLGGADVVLGDNTTFFGNVGAAGGADTIDAGAGDDQVLPGPGDDVVNGGGGDDFLALAVGNDVAQGGHGDDVANGGFGRDTMVGGPGADVLAGGFHDDLVNGGPGDDLLVGEIPADSPPPPPGVVVPAPATNDRCVGASGADTAVDCDKVTGVETTG